MWLCSFKHNELFESDMLLFHMITSNRCYFVHFSRIHCSAKMGLTHIVTFVLIAAQKEIGVYRAKKEENGLR